MDSMFRSMVKLLGGQQGVKDQIIPYKPHVGHLFLVPNRVPVDKATQISTNLSFSRLFNFI
jgi:hypothetical protein